MRVFLSHTSQTNELAKEVGHVLESYGFEVWDDQEDILPGDNWAQKIGEALDRAEAMVVLLTPDAIHSDSVRQSINFALARKHFSNRLIPVFVGINNQAVPNSFPWILHRLKGVTLPDAGKHPKEIDQIAQVLKSVA
jgi:hypothetical protein